MAIMLDGIEARLQLQIGQLMFENAVLKQRLDEALEEVERVSQDDSSEKM